MQIYRQPCSICEPLPSRVVLITGLSNPACCCLHPQLRSFLDSLSFPAEQKVSKNFPFTECLTATSMESSGWNQPKCGDVSIIRASLSNAYQFTFTYGSREFARQAVLHWRQLRQLSGRLLVITGSCGLDLVERLEEQTGWGGHPIENGRTLRVLALGPVARKSRLPVVTAIQGQRDWISKVFYRQAKTSIAKVGHMDYWTSDRIKEMANQWLVDNTSV